MKVLVLAILVAAPAAAQEGPTLENGLPRGLPVDADGRERYNTGWTLALDNDIFSFANRDYDYTSGVAVSFSGRRAQEWPFSLDRVTGWLDPLVPLGSSRTGVPTTALHSLQVGLIAFTPGDLNERAPIPDDRPYASLVFLSGSRTFVSHPSEPVYGTSFTVGVLGTDATEFVQSAIHKEFDFREVPEGWDHQVSDGGEPTFRFTWARQALLASNFQADRTEYELKWQLEASAGYLTEGSIALSGRWGAINTPWWSFTPERADYVSQPAPVIGSSVRDNRELYVWGGVKARVRAYNVFLQGQFRDSAVRVPSREIEPLIAELWLGMTWQVSTRFRLGYVARYQTREIRTGAGNRELFWAGLIINRDL